MAFSFRTIRISSKLKVSVRKTFNRVEKYFWIVQNCERRILPDGAGKIVKKPPSLPPAVKKLCSPVDFFEDILNGGKRNSNIYRNIAFNSTCMGLAKIEEFTVRENKIALYAKALAHPARIAIIELLLKRQNCICGDIVDELPLSQSTVSQHLKELKNAGLIKGEIEGVTTCYCIDENEWALAQQYLGGLLKSAVNSRPCC